MSTMVVRDRYASQYTAAPGRENRDVVAEAYHTAIERLKNELGISLGGLVTSGQDASAKEVLSVVEAAKRRYDEKHKEHTGMRGFLEKISLRIMHYSKVLDSLAQHHPEYVALAWGAMKLVLTKLSQALVAIANVLPRMDLSAELYRTEEMEAALSRLYAHLMLFFHLCVRWYNRGPLGRLCSAITSPFELDYQELMEQIRLSSKEVDDLASAGSRAEIRHVRVLTELQNQQMLEIDVKLLEMLERQKTSEALVNRLLSNADSHRSITERISIDVCRIGQGQYRMEFHMVMRFFEPKVLPETALLKVQSFVRRDLTSKFPSPNEERVRDIVLDWALQKGSPLLIIQVGLCAQKQAKELATNVIQNLKRIHECVFWNLPLVGNSPDTHTMAGLFRSIIFQVFQYSSDLFSSFAEQLDLSKIHAADSEHKWVELLCLLFSKLRKAFVVIETGELQKAYRHDPSWSKRLSEYVQHIVNQSSKAGCELNCLLVLYGNAHRGGAAASGSKNRVDPD
ncbi:hypothetical protein J4E91_004277 [Alternaria rosae]|nr:hypothetical protein J4E91_004277 [Alternaria rosae]